MYFVYYFNFIIIIMIMIIIIIIIFFNYIDDKNYLSKEYIYLIL